MNIRVLLDTIVNEKNEKNWYVPELFVKNTLPLLPQELKIIAPPPEYDKNYNCFIYAFGLDNNQKFIKESSGFIYSPFVKKLIDEGILKETAVAKEGTVILYSNTKELSGEITHAAILKNYTTAISKWSWGPIVEYSLLSVPLSYGDQIRYYELPSAPSIMAAYKKFKHYNHP